MNIQIFGKKKCFDTKKAERFFKDRNIKFQYIDIESKGLSRGEFNSVKTAVGGFEKLFNDSSKDQTALLIKYLADDSEKEQKLLDNPKLFKTPIVRNGKQATVGFCPEIWKSWE
ncbi:MAG: ArsC/Spx/MgsR family protein [Ruminococcus sp.]|nr:ArsC/Spx/MgsR family protein [Ruminococcus sp.]